MQEVTKNLTQSLTHFDPINLLFMIGAVVAFSYRFSRKVDKATDGVEWQTNWIMKHDKECDEQRNTNNKILTELQKISERAGTLLEEHGKRIDRIERRDDQSIGVGR